MPESPWATWRARKEDTATRGVRVARVRTGDRKAASDRLLGSPSEDPPWLFRGSGGGAGFWEGE